MFISHGVLGVPYETRYVGFSCDLVLSAVPLQLVFPGRFDTRQFRIRVHF